MAPSLDAPLTRLPDVGWEVFKRCLVRSIISLVALLAATPISSVTAQFSLQVKPGDRVRVTAPGVFNGAVTVVAVGNDTLVVGRYLNTWRVPVASVTRLEVSQGNRLSAKRAGYGLLIGAAAGAVIGLAAYEECVPHGEAFGCLFDWGPEWGALIGGAVGATFGALIGASTKTERWVDFPLDRLRVSFAPQRDGRFGLGLSVRF